jgi:3'5'-cyclic nucleotide phosphodiesterase
MVRWNLQKNGPYSFDEAFAHRYPFSFAVDHKGVPNAQLVKENSALAQFYNHQSPAEQNSVDLSWQLLMDPVYDDLRGAIYTDEDEYRRFRQLVVNSVMATDIVDKDLKMLRNARWAKAFRSDSPNDEEDPTSSVAINRKATIVIEHLIQASDVAHTMQHWHIYRKWNERFFFECYKAYLEGRADKNPAEGWYQGEIGFYDFYIVPLARKLKDCGVFGVSSDEYLNYAVRNRREWENKGREVVLEMVEKANRELGVRTSNTDSTELMQAQQADIGASTSHSLNKTSHVRYGDH